ncbi:MAG: T9SS type A sorting domain-containing protein [Ignavibacteriales bacterium]|nr:T9SS type A sorting domain-containing protein [Ignavibacteriales bacterium]
MKHFHFKKLTMVFSLLLFSFPLLTYSQTWTSQVSNTTNLLSGVWFTNSMNGWAVGDFGTIRFTTNGGAAWNTLSLTGGDLSDVAFADENIGLIVGDNGAIWRTTNGGTQWSQVASNTVNNLRGVAFGDSGRVYVSGRNSTILRSTDFGSTWSVIETGGIRYQNVAAKGMTRGWIVGEGGVIKSTENGGASWFNQSSGVGGDLSGVFFLTETEGWIGGQDGILLYTNSGGNTWSSRNSGLGVISINGIFFFNSNYGWAVGDGGKIFMTTNGGVNWVAQTSNTSNELYDIAFPDIAHGWVVGDIGTILYTGTPVAIAERNNQFPSQSSLEQNYPNPFNPQTTIGFSLLAVGNVTLKVYNVFGQEVATLLNNELMQSGKNEIQFDGSGLTSGMYFYYLNVNNGEFVQTKKLVLMK